MGLFRKSSNENKIFWDALNDYKNQNYNECYTKINELANNDNARANYLKALLLYNQNINKTEEIDYNLLEELVYNAVSKGYNKAYGYYAFILYVQNKIQELIEFLSESEKIKDGIYLSYKASYLFGLYTDHELADINTTIKLLKESISILENEYQESNNDKNTESQEQELYNPFIYYSHAYVLKHTKFLLMTSYYINDDWNNRQEFVKLFNDVKQIESRTEKFRATILYIKAIIQNVLGMSDLNEANKAIDFLNECYNSLTDEEKEAYSEDYDDIYDKYSEYYEIEKENLDERDIVYSDGYVDQNDISFSNIGNAIKNGIMNYANSSQNNINKIIYTINGKNYTRDDYGYLYDELNIKSGYRIDNYNRLYDEYDNELGYFNNDGIFIES